MSNDDEHLVPVVVKDIVHQHDINNKLTNNDQKFLAEARLIAIINFCQKAIDKNKAFFKK